VIVLFPVLTVLGWLGFLSWLYLLFLRGGFWRPGPQLEAGGSLGSWPPVAAVVPARDEAAVIETALRSLRRLDYPGELRILLVDDGSRDGTASLAANIAAGPGHPLDIIRGEPPPPGWAGKLWTMAQGVERAAQAMPAARFVWFCDADIEHDPPALRALVRKAERDHLDLVSTMALLHCRSFWERMLIPAFVFYFRKLYPFRQVNTYGHPAAAAAGGSMLVRLEALRRTGDLGNIRNAWIDDCALAALIKPAGPIWLGMTLLSRSLRTYRFGDIWRMVARSAYTQLRHSPIRLAAAVLGMLLIYVAPPAALGWGWLFGNVWAAALGGAAWALMILAYLPMLRFYRQPAFLALFMPVTALLYATMTIDSARRHWLGEGGIWKGRPQPPAFMRK